MKTATWLIRGLAFGSGLFAASAPGAVGQTESTLAIRVESNQVLVPTFVFDYQFWNLFYTPAGLRCLQDNAKALQQQGVSVRQAPANCIPGLVPDLAAKDFRLVEDGVEQTIQSIAREHWHSWHLFDNYGSHAEYSGTPMGKWSTSDFESVASWYWSPPAVESYVIAYVPPQSPRGGCHQIKVGVDRPNSQVYNRTEYCNIEHSPSDPLEGTKFGQQMESDSLSARKAKIAILAQSGLFFADSGSMRVHLVLEFPWNSLNREWRNGDLLATIGVLGRVYRKDGTLATRFSDQACCPRDTPLGHASSVIDFDWSDNDKYNIPSRYETQMDLPSGEYDLRVVLSDSKKFGRVNIPLTIESYDKQPLDLSSVALCKRFHKVDPPSYTEGILPSKFVPLVSKGMEFTPAADTTFKKHDPLFAYFEVYVPRGAGAAANIQFQLRITNADTGQLKIDSGPRPATEFLQPGKEFIPIVQEVAIHELPKGNYRLEVQASDSAGNHTPWHAATFAIR
ncbi:MAG: hypothetical protein WB994_07180 [Candidatus Acidiferrum sp.]